MAEEELKQLREKLEKQEQEFQNYRQECKVLQNFLEEESQKKQQQIRKLKEQAIVKEKNFKLLKTENAQMQTQINSLKDQLSELKEQIQGKSSDQKNSKLLQDQNSQLLSQIESLKKQLTNQPIPQDNSSQLKSLEESLALHTKQNKKLASKMEEMSKELEQQKLKASQYSNSINEKSKQIAELKQKISKLNKKVGQQKTENQKLSAQKGEMETKVKQKEKMIESSHKKTVKKEDTQRNKELEKQLQKAEQKIKRYEQKILKMDAIIKELKQKLSQSKLSLSPQKGKQQDQASPQSKLFTACVICTKPFYISPFLEVKQQSKIVKIYKASRHGCFQKALGSTKHKLDALSYEHSQITTEIAKRIKQEHQSSHFVLIFGSKKTSKKLLMTTLIEKLIDFLKQMIQKSSSTDVQATYIRKTADEEEVDEHQQAITSEDTLDLLDVVTHQLSSSIKKTQKQKKNEKPRVCYFSIRINEFCLQIATSSFTNIPVRQKDSLSTFYNNILFSKLPDILQNRESQKYLILPLNPIVELYDDCKNVLSATLYRTLFTDSIKPEQKQFQIGKQMLNAMARRKLQQYERQFQSNGIKIRKIEDECFFYKMKFQQLEERLKNLISTHHNQSSYLKKSPILLSYEKMLKFVHSVQSKYSAGQENGHQVINLNDLDFESDISLQAL